MPEKNNSNSNAPGTCQRLFNFFMNSIIARGLKRVTLGQSLPQGYDSSIPAKSNGELMVHHMDHKKSKQNSGSEIRVLFKQSEELESWTPVDPVVPKIPDQTGIETVSEQQQPSGRKKEIPLAPLEKKEQRRQGKRSDQMKGSEEKDGRKIKGESIASEDLILPIEDDEEVKMTPRRSRPPLSVAPNINEKSDEFIRLKKEAMRRMEPKKNP